MKKFLLLVLILSVLFQNVCAFNMTTIISDYEKRIENFVPKRYENTEIIFSDLIEVEWAQESIYYLASKNIINGVGENMFAPDKSITRAEFIKLVLTATGLVDEESKTESVSGWEYIYVATAEQLGFTDVFDTVDYSVPILRDEMAYIAGKALEILGFDMKYEYSNMFTDDSIISDKVKKYVYSLKDNKIINGYETGEFKPKNTARRCEAAVIVYNLYTHIDTKLYLD